MRNTIGIRREDKNDWERRAPIIPDHLRPLTQAAAARFVIQPSDRRIFSELEYQAGGASIHEELQDCDIILGVKEIPAAKILADKVYLLFSHTIKAQPHNLAMLRQFMRQRCTLIDYECITDAQGKRLVFFGRYAGWAGMLETLRGLGWRWQLQGYATPLLDLGPAFEFHSIDQARERLQRIGEIITLQQEPFTLAPVIVGFSGYGQVSSAAQELFDLLPCQEINPEQVTTARPYPGFYKTVFREEDLVKPRDSQSVFSLSEYYAQPDLYRSQFDSYLPHLTVLVNAIYWDDRYPRLVSKKALADLARTRRLRLQMIGDISCDIHGAIECTEHFTTPEDPFFTYEPLTDTWQPGVSTNGVTILAVDNLPAELPRDASIGFSGMLSPWLSALAKVDFQTPLDRCGLPAELRRAVILYQGELTPPFKYLADYL